MFLFLISGYVLLRLFQSRYGILQCNYAGIVLFCRVWCYMSYVYCQKIFSENKKESHSGFFFLMEDEILIVSADEKYA